jgi:hypothetical protein
MPLPSTGDLECTAYFVVASVSVAAKTLPSNNRLYFFHCSGFRHRYLVTLLCNHGNRKFFGVLHSGGRQYEACYFLGRHVVWCIVDNVAGS